MSAFTYSHRRLKVFFSDHALDRWWERCQENGELGRQAAMDLLRERLDGLSKEDRRVLATTAPPWSRLSLWHRARAESYLMLSDTSVFVLNRNETGDLVAVTYIEPEESRK